MLRMLLKLGKWMAISIVLCLAAVLAVRAWDSQQGEPLALWQTFVPDELTPAQLDATDWAGYLAAEQKAFEEVRTQVSERLEPAQRVATNRYYAGAPMYPGRLAHDWNRSYVLEPRGAPVGAVVLIHGLTDAPYSLRDIAQLYRAHGFVAIGLRVPGHGTVPAALTKAAADQGIPEAQVDTCAFYYQGVGVQKDLVQAYLYANLAAQQGSEDGRSILTLLSQDMKPEDVAKGDAAVRAWKPVLPDIKDPNVQ